MNLEALSNLASMQQPIQQPVIPPPNLKRSSTGPTIFPEELHRNGDINISSDNDMKSPMTLLVGPPVASRQTSFGTKSVDWARQVTLEERLYIREKIKAAYRKKVQTFDDLIDTCAAIDEELMFAAAPSRLDYFKSGVYFEKRVADKVSQVLTPDGGHQSPVDLEVASHSEGSPVVTSNGQASKKIKLDDESRAEA